jgi:hypothetical protein
MYGMRVFAIARALGLCCAVACVSGCSSPSPTPAPAASAAPAPAQKTATPVERGQYLTGILGCHDCHTPFKMGAAGPEPDMARMLSGHPQDVKLPRPPALTMTGWAWAGSATNTAFAGPWGVSYAINLTPDQATGLGAWTEEMFIASIRTGKHLGTSRPIQPPMPWQSYMKMTDDDLKALYAYLRTIPVIANQAPPYEPPRPPAK